MSLITLAITTVAFFSAVVVGINLLPTTSQIPISPEFATSISTIYGYLFAWNSVFPFDTLILCASLALGLELAMFIWSMIRWVTNVVRGSGA